jgi:hypothetical protein
MRENFKIEIPILNSSKSTNVKSFLLDKYQSPLGNMVGEGARARPSLPATHTHSLYYVRGIRN